MTKKQIKFPENTYISLRESLMFHHAICDEPYVDDVIVEAYDDRANMFIETYLSLRTKLLEKDASYSNEELRTLVYDVAKPIYGSDKTALKNWFADMNIVLMDKAYGPQLSVFIQMYGYEAFVDKVDHRLNNYLSFFDYVGYKRGSNATSIKK